MKIGSLFSGIGGLDLGVEQATGGTVVWQCEANTYCREVLAKHWPGVPCFDDVVELEPPGPVDLICGGFPCQDISNAGRKTGINGKKSGLWSEYARILGGLLPRYVFVENVAVLSRRGLYRVLGDLAALGYAAVWDTLGACCVGAPHRRERLFVLAIRDRDRDRESTGALDGEAPELSSVVGSDLADAYAPQRQRNRGPVGGEAGSRPRHSSSPGWWETEPAVDRVVYGLPRRVDQLKALGNAVVPAQAEAAFRILWQRLHARA